MENAELIAVCDVVPGRAEAVASEYGARAFATVEEMVEAPGLDAVEVVTPSAHHAHPAIVAAKAGKHVAGRDAVRDHPGRVRQDDRHRRGVGRQPDVRPDAPLQRPGAQDEDLDRQRRDRRHSLGDLDEDAHRKPEVAPLRPHGPRRTGESRWRRSGGGFFVYEGTHLTDMFRWFTGSDVTTVFSVGLGVYASIGDGEDNAIGALRFESGAFGTINEGTSDPGGHRPRLGGSSARRA